MATQRHVLPHISQREEVTQGGTQTMAHSKEEARKTGGQRVKKDKLVAKVSGETKKAMTSLGRGRGKGATKDAQQLQAKMVDTETPGNAHLQLTLQVRVEGALNQHQLLVRDRAKGKGKATESKERYKRPGKAGEDERKSGGPSLETKAGDSKKEEASVGNRNGRGQTVPGCTTAIRKAKGKEATEGKLVKVPGRTGDDLGLSVKDYLYLFKLLRIKLPEGVLNTEIIEVSKTEKCVADARSITTALENFKLMFSMTPRLGCREVKRALALKTNEDVLELTKIIFFEISKKEDRGALMENWKKNSANTGKGFRMRDRYRNTPVSTPAMYLTAITRSLSSSEHKDNKAKVTDGVRVNVKDLENMEYSDESLLDTSSTDRFGKYHQNKTDEVECLKFFHELGGIDSDQVGVRYTKGNKVDCGFLSGRLDFLAQIQKVSGKKSTVDERLVIECKGTTGDMVGKLFTKSSEHRALLVKTHEYCYQTQAYMYILNQEARLLKRSVSNRAVMVIRHYHGDSTKEEDFHWSYLQVDDKIQRDISDLTLYCQREVLARFLAVLDLIFQKEIT